MKRLLTFFLFLALLSQILYAQETRREKRKAREKARNEEVYKLVNEKDLRFLAQMAIPVSGSPVYLTTEYTLDIEKDKITSHLPYFGVAYSASYGGDGGIQFSETAGQIKWEETKNGFDIIMEVRSPKDLYHMRLSVQSTGYATLMVSSNNRQSIHFSGIITERKKETL